MMGALAYFADKDGSFRDSLNDSWDQILSKHPIPFYYCIGHNVNAGGSGGRQTATIPASQMGQYENHYGDSSRLNTSCNSCGGVGHTSMNYPSVVNASGQRVKNATLEVLEIVLHLACVINVIYLDTGPTIVLV